MVPLASPSSAWTAGAGEPDTDVPLHPGVLASMKIACGVNAGACVPVPVSRKYRGVERPCYRRKVILNEHEIREMPLDDECIIKNQLSVFILWTNASCLKKWSRFLTPRGNYTKNGLEQLVYMLEINEDKENAQER